MSPYQILSLACLPIPPLRQCGANPKISSKRTEFEVFTNEAVKSLYSNKWILSFCCKRKRRRIRRLFYSLWQHLGHYCRFGQGFCHFFSGILEAFSDEEVQSALFQNFPGFLCICPFEADDNGNVRLHNVRSFNDSSCNSVATYDTTEDINEDRANVRV